ERRGVERHDVGEHQAGHQTSDIRHQRSASGSCTGNRPGDRRTGVSETMTISRRVFVKSGGLALFSLGLDPLFLARAAFAVRPSAGPPDRRMLVCLFQRGAVDGLNMVVPHGDPLYYRERPRIAVPEPDVVDLDGHFGLHPRLAALKPLWENKSLAAIHAIGSPDSTRSHFDAQDYMESGTPGAKATPDGWLNRYCQHDREHQDTPFRAVAFGPQLPRILAGSAPSLAIDDLQAFGLRAPQPAARDRLTRAFEELYAGSATGLLSTSSQEAFEAVQMLKQVSPSQYQPAHGADYPRGRFGKAMMQIAQLIKADVGLQLAFADVTGWDTHVNQGSSDGQLAARLADFGQALAAFAQDLGEKLRDVVVLTMSEFGRTVRENGNSGTDHGHATAMLVMGGPVNGGRMLGRWPGLDPADRFEGRDVAGHEHAALRLQAVRPHDEPRERHVLPCHADLAAPDLAVPDELAGHELGGVDPHGEADALRREDHRGVDADHAARGIHQRPARVPGVERGVGLDHVVDQSPRHGAERAPQRAHHAGRDGALKAE